MPEFTKRQLFSLTAASILPIAMSKTHAASFALPDVEVALNENPFGPSPAAKHALITQLGLANRYGDSSAADKLVAQISAFENIPPEQVILGEVLALLGLFLAARTPVGGNVVYSTPGYTALVDAGKPAGLRGIGVPLDEKLGNDLAGLGKAITPDTKALYLINPHNPSGTITPPDVFDAFLKETSKKTLVIVDEAYIEYSQTARTAASLTRAGANVAVFRTFDKVYGLAGLPIGYLLAPRPLADQLHDAGLGNPHEIGRLAIAAASAALGDQAWIKSVRERVISGRTRLTQTLDDLKIEHTNSEANFVFFKSPKPANEVRQRLQNLGIIIARPFPPLNDWLRVSVGTETELTRVITALKKALST